MNIRKQQKPCGYTLMEILVVTAILAGLAAVGYPILTRQIDKGRETEAVQSMKDIENALNSYVKDNSGMLPEPLSPINPISNETLYVSMNQAHSWLWNALEGESDSINNIKGKTYLTFPVAKNDKGGVTRGTGEIIETLSDPWGRSYFLILDYGDDGELSLGAVTDTPMNNFPFATDKMKGQVGMTTKGKKDTWDPDACLTTWR